MSNLEVNNYTNAVFGECEEQDHQHIETGEVEQEHPVRGRRGRQCASHHRTDRNTLLVTM